MSIRFCPEVAREALLEISRKLEVDPDHLDGLIQFESRWNPRIANPTSSARGLIQFMAGTAQDLGYEDSNDLIEIHPDVVSQLRCPVYRYLRPMSPYRSLQSLCMAVFYPRARNWAPQTPFPGTVQRANPGIVTVQDYLDHVRERIGS